MQVQLRKLSSIKPYKGNPRLEVSKRGTLVPATPLRTASPWREGRFVAGSRRGSKRAPSRLETSLEPLNEKAVEAVPPAADPAELLKAAKGREPQTRRIGFGDPGNGRRGGKAAGGATKKAKGSEAKAGKGRARKTTKRTSKKTKATKSAKAGR